MADFTFVTARIATGAALRSKADVRKILVAGINVLIDCRETTDGPLLNGHSAIEYLWNPTADDGTPKPPEYWARSLTFVLPLLSQPHTKVLCHCTSGAYVPASVGRESDTDCAPHCGSAVQSRCAGGVSGAGLCVNCGTGSKNSSKPSVALSERPQLSVGAAERQVQSLLP